MALPQTSASLPEIDTAIAALVACLSGEAPLQKPVDGLTRQRFEDNGLGFSASNIAIPLPQGQNEQAFRPALESRPTLTSLLIDRKPVPLPHDEPPAYSESSTASASASNTNITIPSSVATIPTTPPSPTRRLITRNLTSTSLLFGGLCGNTFQTSSDPGPQTNISRQQYTFIHPSTFEPVYVYPSHWKRMGSWLSGGSALDALPVVHVKETGMGWVILRKSSAEPPAALEITDDMFTLLLRAAESTQKKASESTDRGSETTDGARVVLAELRRVAALSAELNFAILGFLRQQTNGEALVERFKGNVRPRARAIAKKICLLAVMVV